ncbi:hypothetical protein B0T11DRAFT_16436 [Plectosphaerella cucumerina]|uniref:GED domain-containing protein n=1 Tax=Plectosphaerella cucumerina TaxID=40658 RepID=A0A8K0X8M1_9PEZI|nr:hypothetical protein B0T11DRAFT_16436 [Plectosphaerella cucumerina]
MNRYDSLRSHAVRFYLDTTEDAFFRGEPWSSQQSQLSVVALRKHLGRFLYDHIRRATPRIIADIQLQLSDRRDKLSRPEQPQVASGSPRVRLTAAAQRFRDLVADGIKGHYADPFFGGFESHDRKLRAQLRNWNRAIRHILRAHGSTYDVVEQQENMPGSDQRHEMPLYLAELVRVDEFPAPKIITRADLVAKLEHQAAMNQGMGLPGFPSMEIATRLFQEQTKQWEPLAAQHLDNVLSTVRDFVEQAVIEATGPSNERVRAAILSIRVEPFFEVKRKVLSARLKEILRPFKESYAMALDVVFLEAMQDIANRSTRQTFTSSTNSFGTDFLVDAVQTCCEMSLRTFTDNLVNLVIESCLVRELENIFNPSLVAAMSDKKLSAFEAGEETGIHDLPRLRFDVSLLENALQKCQHHFPRWLRLRQNKSPQTTIPPIGNGLAASRHAPQTTITTLSRTVQGSNPVVESSNPASLQAPASTSNTIAPTPKVQESEPSPSVPASSELAASGRPPADTQTSPSGPSTKIRRTVLPPRTAVRLLALHRPLPKLKLPAPRHHSAQRSHCHLSSSPGFSPR